MLKYPCNYFFAAEPLFFGKEVPGLVGETHGLALLLLVASFVANTKAMTTFGTATGQYLAASVGLHPGAKTVLVSSFSITGLKCTLHCYFF